ncbi:hypothetical protein HBI56_131310 [Parastagonospora nodorum]|uniref:Uncharacterized protein n=1 Tax=Phaeosphaeria nodorum (strain SN15 / ATCC MYA-4574 / FGSC 10173) TaxID=321614 RepID=A0A7U2I1M8_PHANO|nr:hypothetical protein HBH56_152500 [Parastagonospora nodorum]QRC96087.1 hypothetical protein JI435_057230 [Parastagonospora nodorum SN15]KAH3926831.1 hypothetical protein HBH54_165180 [Parastagonospora nodorum]KAH3940414.1 hypothetical protein HBH53_218120 [Parastagonospora nodorum]KAH3970152.1 hypothetical protein HBH52_165690 [Parastagonospora nodorum]
MPCSDLTHKHSWPTSGSHTLRIESCETRCGWCKTTTTAANNLRVHARRHVQNPKNTSLRLITVSPSKAGRTRVSLQTDTTCISRLQCNHQIDYEKEIQDLRDQIQLLESDNERLKAALCHMTELGIDICPIAPGD